jgi:hypothetical protein
MQPSRKEAVDATVRWEQLLHDCCQCPTAEARRIADLLAQEGLQPDDPTSVDALTPDLFDALGIVDAGLQERLRLASKQSAFPSRSRKGGPAEMQIACPTRSGSTGQPTRQPHSSATLARMAACGLMPDGSHASPAPDNSSIDEDEVTGFGRFQRRHFRGAGDRRGTVAQEVVPGLFLGSRKAAADVAEQKALGITHVINATAHRVSDEGGATVLLLGLRDADGDQNISRYFLKCNTFISSALTDGGAVLVHCIRGVSRSSALVMAFLLSHTGMSVDTALQVVRRARPVAKPRDGFLKQLRAYEIELKMHARTPQKHGENTDLLALMVKQDQTDVRCLGDRAEV